MDEDAPTRRRFLAASALGAAAASAGCLDLLDSSTERGDDGATLSLSLRREDGPLREQYVVDLTETRPSWDEEAFEVALDGETYTTQYRRPFFSTEEDPKYALRDGTYYRLGAVVVDEAAETHPVLRLYEADDGEAVASAELPEADERAVKRAHVAARARGNEGGVPWGLVERGGYVYRSEEAVDASRLLADDGPDHVTFRDTRYRVEVSRERFHEPVYRATVEPVAESPERMEAILRAKFVEARVDREALSPDARDVMRAAEADGYEETHPFSDAFESVLRALHARAYVDGNVQKDALPDDHRRNRVLYDGTYFDYWLRFVDGAG